MPSDADPLLTHCRFRVSARSRHLRITITARSGLTVTRPPYVSQSEAEAFVRSRRGWIERHLSRLSAAAPPPPPTELHLRLTEERLRLRYVETTGASRKPSEEPGLLTLFTTPESPETARKALKHWLKQRAQGALKPRLDALSEELELPYNRLSLRMQRTRWGSCSNRRDISLNAKLLFLPETLARHVLIHELAHTVHLDHSPDFWRLVASADPHWRTHRNSLRATGSLVPAWLESD